MTERLRLAVTDHLTVVGEHQLQLRFSAGVTQRKTKDQSIEDRLHPKPALKGDRAI